MSADLFEQTRRTDLERATKEYAAAKENYQRLVRLALQERDPVKREEQIKAIQAENARLVRVVEGLIAIHNEGSDEKDYEKAQDLDQEIAEFQHDLELLQTKQDTITQLRGVLSTLTAENDSAKSTYYGYIIAVLVLLVVVFLFFVYSYVSCVAGWFSSAASSAVSLVDETPEVFTESLPTLE